jgi:hypothetical protein
MPGMMSRSNSSYQGYWRNENYPSLKGDYYAAAEAKTNYIRNIANNIGEMILKHISNCKGKKCE